MERFYQSIKSRLLVAEVVARIRYCLHVYICVRTSTQVHVADSSCNVAESFVLCGKTMVTASKSDCGTCLCTRSRCRAKLHD